MSKIWYPIIDYAKCTACNKCIEACKHGVFKQDEQTGKPKLSYSQGCITGCHFCQKVCPEHAITYFGDDGLLDINYTYESYKPHIKCQGKPKVAFICVHNSCRSQLAEALGKKLACDVFDSYSAGTELKPKINQDAVRILKQVHNIDMEESQYNKLISDIPTPDVVIFMGCNVSCPFVPSQYSENWGLEDPTGKGDQAFLDTIHKIENRIQILKQKLS